MSLSSPPDLNRLLSSLFFFTEKSFFIIKFPLHWLGKTESADCRSPSRGILNFISFGFQSNEADSFVTMKCFPLSNNKQSNGNSLNLVQLCLDQMTFLCCLEIVTFWHFHYNAHQSVKLKPCSSQWTRHEIDSSVKMAIIFLIIKIDFIDVKLELINFTKYFVIFFSHLCWR